MNVNLPFDKIAVAVMLLVLVLIFFPKGVGFSSEENCVLNAHKQDVRELTKLAEVCPNFSVEELEIIQAQLTKIYAGELSLPEKSFSEELGLKIGVWILLLLLFFVVFPVVAGFLSSFEAKSISPRYEDAPKKIISENFQIKIKRQLQVRLGKIPINNYDLVWDLLGKGWIGVVRLRSVIETDEAYELENEEIAFVDMQKEVVVAGPKHRDKFLSETGKTNLLDALKCYFYKEGLEEEISKKLDVIVDSLNNKNKGMEVLK